MDYDYELDRDSARWEKAEFDAMMDAANDALMEQVAETIHEQSLDTMRAYLGTYGDAISGRIEDCLDDARACITAGRHGPAVTSACTAIELTINYLVLRPLVQGTFLSDAWAAILTDTIVSSRQYRGLLPAIAAGWELDLAAIKLTDGAEAWGAFTGEIWPLRRRVVHEGEQATKRQATRAIECAEVLLRGLVEPVADRLDRAWPTDRWSEPAPSKYGAIGPRYAERDPFKP